MPAKDAIMFMVLLEESRAFLGLVRAIVGISVSGGPRSPDVDGLISIGIGLILAVVAVLLSYDSKGLSVGESADG